MREIWKFHLEPDELGRCIAVMPRIRQCLHVGEQEGEIVLWAAVDPNAGKEHRQFFILGTGWRIPAEAVYYRGTVQMPSELVWHVWETS